MGRVKRIVVFVVVLAVIGAFFVSPVLAQDPERTFSNGVVVRGDFLRFYDSADDPELLFGLPVAPEAPTADGTEVQYFSRVRMELVNGEVRLTPLGQQFYQEGSPLASIPNQATACRRFATGKSVCYAFLQFYDEHNGPVYFGQPISNMEIHDGSRFVQYFENVRLEWQPENATGERVALTELGTLAYQEAIQNVPFGSNIPVLPGEANLQAYAFVTEALAPANSQQTLYLIVQNAKYEPVTGATARVTVYYPGGRQDDVRVPFTDANGISRIQFAVRDVPVAEVVRVEVNVEYQGMKAHTASWFRIWW